jgi:glycosyltransferase involved in cell wall biosynthesis
MVAALQDVVAVPETPAPRQLTTANGKRPFVMIDGFNLRLEKGTGVATYARNLTFALRDLACDVGVLYGGRFGASDDPLLQEVLFFDSELPTGRWWHSRCPIDKVLAPTWNTAFEVPVTGTVIADPFVSSLPHYDSIWNVPRLYQKAHAQFDLFRLINSVHVKRKPDVCHWTYPLPLRIKGVPNIYTLHDLVPLRLPYTTLDKKARYFRLVKWICRNAAHIITVSENSKRDIVDLLGVDPAKVTNTYEAVSIPERYRTKPEEIVRREIEGTFGLEYKDYFLFYGSIEPKKNINRMLQGYLASGVTTPLVIVGAQAWKSEQELGLLAAQEVRKELRDGERTGGRIVKLEYVPFALLVSLIRGAKTVLFPSLYEGFGLPVLESMLLGTPVLTSRSSSVPEIAGDAALLIDPYDPLAIAEGIRALDENKTLRGDLATRGVRRAELFDERAYRERLLGVYENVLRTCATRLL